MDRALPGGVRGDRRLRRARARGVRRGRGASGAAGGRRRAGLGGALARVPPAGPRRAVLDRTAVGDAGHRRGAARDRSRPRVRHRCACHDAPLHRAALGAGARVAARRRHRLGHRRDRGCDSSASRRFSASTWTLPRWKPHARTPPRTPSRSTFALPTRRRNRSRRSTSRSRTSRFALVESLLPRIEARVVVTSGYLERDDPRLGPYARRARRVRDGWAADLLERAE